MSEMPKLHIEELRVRTDRGREILKVPRLSVPAGTTLGIRGPSGAGKSTFLMALAGLLDAASGRILWDGTDILALPQAARAKFRATEIGFVFQDFLLFEELGAGANAGLPALYMAKSARSVVHERGVQALVALGISARAQPVTTMSGGERQRVAVARALATDASVILADEPTANLDRTTADALIEDVMQRVRADGKTLIAVSHDTHFLERMDRVHTLADGTLSAEAVHA